MVRPSVVFNWPNGAALKNVKFKVTLSADGGYTSSSTITTLYLINGYGQKENNAGATAAGSRGVRFCGDSGLEAAPLNIRSKI